ncbi:MAG TPA: sigma 54-interacting transcriptional regulator [Polyangiales bacterium]|nr:sigma 54-interacting transcriptional regulator [Polyangiales bacterium]
MTLTRTESAPISRIAFGGLHRLLVVYSATATDVGHSRTLAHDALVIGRDPESNPCLQLHQTRVSRRHAQVELAADARSWQLEDLQSRNGTFVNGERVERAQLRDGDVIRIGSTLLLFQFLDAAACARVLEADSVGMAGLIGHGHGLARVREAIRTAPQSAPTLVLGETGVGKELVARAIHDHSGRSGPFAPVNCAALPSNLAESELFGHVRGAFTGADARRGLFGRADHGTLFMDEIGELSAEVQAKVLRALAIGEVRPVGSDHARQLDVRIIAATNVDLEGAVASGRFRADLYARLMSHIIAVPPLRERREDVLDLTRHFLRSASGAEITPDCAEALLIYGWPYNVRELEQVLTAVESVVRQRGTLELTDLPQRIRHQVESRLEPVQVMPSSPSPLLDMRRNAVPTADELQAAMRAYNGNVARVASFFRKDRRQIYRWAEALGIDIQALRD